jgi:hypothetical protein
VVLVDCKAGVLRAISLGNYQKFNQFSGTKWRIMRAAVSFDELWKVFDGVGWGVLGILLEFWEEEGERFERVLKGKGREWRVRGI